MKNIIIGFYMIFVLSVNAYSGETSIYKNKNFNFTTNYPSDWVVQEKQNGQVYFWLLMKTDIMALIKVLA